MRANARSDISEEDTIAAMSASRHAASLIGGDLVHRSDLGSATRVDADGLPVLKGLSIKRLLLAPGAMREPHWHANAAELTYCSRGSLLVSVLDTGSEMASFTLGLGQMFHVDSGSLHHIENVGDGEAELIVAFGHERPADFSLHAAFGAMSDAVLGNTYDLPAAAFAAIARSTDAPYLVRRDGTADVPSTAGLNDPHRFDVEAQSAPVQTAAGSARLANGASWPALTDIAMYSLRITPEGMREPHWHPQTAEMGYVHAGEARMTILDPDGTLDTYELKVGDVYFVPSAYPHHIEVLSPAEVHILVFFDRSAPADIGYRASATALSREVLAATLWVTPGELPELPFTPQDPLLVDRSNPVDPMA